MLIMSAGLVCLGRDIQLQMASSSSTTDTRVKQRQPPVIQPGSGNSIIINPCQRLNPIVECIRNVPKEFGEILPDYQVGRTTGVLFLRSLRLSYSSRLHAEYYWVALSRSLRYHRLHPEYIHQRIERLGHAYNLRILLLMCDIVRGTPYSVSRILLTCLPSRNTKIPFEN